jgi:hypothetical protein
MSEYQQEILESTAYFTYIIYVPRFCDGMLEIYRTSVGYFFARCFPDCLQIN